MEVFHNLADAQVKLALYRRFYNEERPHSSFGYRPPAAAHALFLTEGLILKYLQEWGQTRGIEASNRRKQALQIVRLAR